MADLQQNTILITGGATGIGFALAEKFYHSAEYSPQHSSNKIILVGRRAQALAKAKEKLSNIITVTADITKAADRERLLAEFPEVSILINNAGIQFNGDFTEQSQEEIMAEININLTSPLLLTHTFLPSLRKRQNSAVVFVSSGLALVPKESAAVYCASKAAIRSFSQSLRWQLKGNAAAHTAAGQYPVRVFELIPPLVDTDMTKDRGHESSATSRITSTKISPEALAEEFYQAFTNNKYQIMGGKTKLLYQASRFFPTLAQKLMRKGV